jgi:16S rRNA (guanine(527)-N(7))-methyltransferase RsmG
MVRRMVTREPGDGVQDAAIFRRLLVESARELGHPLDEEQTTRMTEHYRLLREWGGRMNLTGLKDREAILRRHFLEPFFAYGMMKGEGTLIDLGSGNGFPGVPLAVLHRGTRLVLVEASERKCAFLWMILRGLGLKAAQVVTRRICRRADLSEFLPARWVSFRAIKIGDCLKPPGPDLIEPGGGLIGFVAGKDSDDLREHPPDGLVFQETRPITTSPGDVVIRFEPARH